MVRFIASSSFCRLAGEPTRTNTVHCKSCVGEVSLFVEQFSWSAARNCAYRVHKGDIGRIKHEASVCVSSSRILRKGCQPPVQQPHHNNCDQWPAVTKRLSVGRVTARFVEQAPNHSHQRE